MTGTIPAELGRLQALTELRLSGNTLTGTIPAELGRLQALTVLRLSGNKLTGTIPAELGRLQALTVLSLGGNKLTGSIPAGLGELHNLQYLTLEGNQFKGTIPVELGSLPRLWHASFTPGNPDLHGNPGRLDDRDKVQIWQRDLPLLTERDIARYELQTERASSIKLKAELEQARRDTESLLEKAQRASLSSGVDMLLAVTDAVASTRGRKQKEHSTEMQEQHPSGGIEERAQLPTASWRGLLKAIELMSKGDATQDNGTVGTEALAEMVQEEERATRHWDSLKMHQNILREWSPPVSGEARAEELSIGEIEAVLVDNKGLAGKSLHEVVAARDGERKGLVDAMSQLLLVSAREELPDKIDAEKREIESVEGLLAPLREFQTSSRDLLEEDGGQGEDESFDIGALWGQGEDESFDIGALCTEVLQAVRQWEAAHDLAALAQSTDGRCRELGQALAKALGSLGGTSPGVEEGAGEVGESEDDDGDIQRCLRLAAKAAQAAVDDEESGSELSSLLKDLPLIAVLQAGERLLAYHRQRVETMEGLGARRGVFLDVLAQQQGVVSSACYPPDISGLKALRAELHDLQDEVDMLKLKITQKQRRGEPTDGLQTELKRVISDITQKKLSRHIMAEESKLYRLAQEHYPELLLEGNEWGKEVGIDASSFGAEARRLGLLADGRTLQSFAKQTLLSTQAGRRVYLVEEAGESMAEQQQDGVPLRRKMVVKEFSLKLERDMRHFYRQVALLHQLRHPNLVGVCAVFQDLTAGSCYLQMPHYGGGDLRAWMDANPATARDAVFCAQILSDVLAGLHHLHANGLVHCDLKPSNVLLTTRGTAVLSDFDGLRKEDDLASGVGSTTFVGGIQGTMRYLPPELLQPPGTSVMKNLITPSVDMFAFGRVAEELLQEGVQLSWRRGEGGDRKAEHRRRWDSLKGFITALVADDPAKRMSSSDALAHPLLVELGRRTMEGEDRVKQRKLQCVVCFDTFLAAEGVQCDAEHFICDECLEGYVTAKSESEERKALYKGGLQCPQPGCASNPFQGHTIASHVPASVYEAYRTALNAGLETKVVQDMERVHEERLEAMRRDFANRSAADALEEEARQHSLRVIETVINLACPRCKQAFADFIDCFALKCGRCAAAFCAYCLADCGRDAHRHVASCALNPTGGLFGTFDDFEAAQKGRREKLLAAYLQPLRAEVRVRVAELLQPHVEGLGLSIGGPGN